MPTPDAAEVVEASHPSVPTATQFHQSLHTTCPPDDSRLAVTSRPRTSVVGYDGNDPSALPRSAPTQSAPTQQATSPVETGTGEMTTRHLTRRTNADNDTFGADEALSPMSTTSDGKEGDQKLASFVPPSAAATTAQRPSSSSMSYEFSDIRLFPNSCSSFLRSGSKFRGTQQSDRQVYEVQVDLKHVDMSQSFLCGYLRIQGLTEDHPTLTTYFEGEIVGDKYSFQTNHPEWGSNDKVDMQHWARFHAWRPLAKSAKKPDFAYKNYMQRENIFMRWKESFLVPDHTVRTITGASFDGFYFICFNQVSGNISGIYFHAKSEKYQQLELTHIDDRGCTGALEFR
ncbi:MAG: hypothetical protein M1825_004131 [Sarcosagium campestre]|nr:MAG: hypothetical protein M1825_004131 [Sarcosagium campestre]